MNLCTDKVRPPALMGLMGLGEQVEERGSRRLAGWPHP